MARTLIDVVTTTGGLPGGSVEANRRAMLERVDEALREPADLLCLPETFALAGLGYEPVMADIHSYAEPVPGPTVDAFAQQAREHRCYVFCPLLTRREGTIYNSVVVLDRDGQVLGVYDKQHPVTVSADFSAAELHARPGEGDGVFDLDCGRVGVRICFDATFNRTWQDLADAAVDLVVWPSAYPGGMTLRAFAFAHRYWVVAATGKPPAVMVDPCGQVVAGTSEGTPWVRHRLNLDCLVAHRDFNYSIPKRIAAVYGERVRVELHQPEERMLIEPRDPRLTTAALAEEFGIESLQRYCARHERMYAALRANQPPAPQAAAHGRRPQWREE